MRPFLEHLRFAVLNLLLLLGVDGCGNVTVQQPANAAQTSHPQAVTGSAVLSWDPVTRDVQGNILHDLAGYKIHYGTSEALNNVQVLSNPDQTSYVMQGLSPGTWYFAASAYTTEGTESALSAVVSKAIE